MAKQLSEEKIYEEAKLRVKEKKGFWGILAPGHLLISY